MKIKKIALTLLFLLLINKLLSQTLDKVRYHAFNTDSINKLFEKNYNFELSKLNKPFKKDIKTIYKKRYDEYYKLFNDSLFIFNKNSSNFINEIVNEIAKNNPSYSFNDYIFLLTKSPIPNATCYGDKTFMINSGLFNLLNNEDQLAFVISHEISHYLLNHVNHSIYKRAKTLNSKSTIEKAKEIKRSKFGRNTKGMELIKNLTFDYLIHKRKNEIKADSLGYLLLKNTKYNLIESKEALKLLEETENLIFKDSINLKSFFNFKEYKFKNDWLTPENTIFNIKEKNDDYKWDKDSLKTHPAIDKRISILSKKKESPKETYKSIYLEIKNSIKKQQIIALIETHQLDYALYIALNEINKTNNSFYHGKVVEIFIDLYYQVEKHKLGKYVPRENILVKEKNINDIRRFIHNLELKEIRKIGYYYFKENESYLKQSSNHKSLLSKLKQLNKIQ